MYITNSVLSICMYPINTWKQREREKEREREGEGEEKEKESISMNSSNIQLLWDSEVTTSHSKPVPERTSCVRALLLDDSYETFGQAGV